MQVWFGNQIGAERVQLAGRRVSQSQDRIVRYSTSTLMGLGSITENLAVFDVVAVVAVKSIIISMENSII
jgi:hypothetical protein